MLPTPPYRQLSGLLDYLYTALRSDRWLLHYLGTAHMVVAKTMEHDPITIRDDGAIALMDTELPVLALWEAESIPVLRNRRWGEQSTLRMLYVMQLGLGNVDISPQAWGQRISKLVWWRICHYLHRRRYDTDEHTDLDGYVVDRLSDCGIRTIQPTRARRLGSTQYEGIAADVTMEHLQAPYDEDAVPIITQIEHVIHDGTEGNQTVPTTTGPIVTGDYTGV